MKSIKPKGKTLGVVGLGYVGLPLALLAKKKGFYVVGVDTNKEKIELIAQKKSPFADEWVEKEIKKDRTRTFLRKLSEEERAAEIARMFGGGPESALRHARELLANSE